MALSKYYVERYSLKVIIANHICLHGFISTTYPNIVGDFEFTHKHLPMAFFSRLYLHQVLKCNQEKSLWRVFVLKESVTLEKQMEKHFLSIEY